MRCALGGRPLSAACGLGCPVSGVSRSAGSQGGPSGTSGGIRDPGFRPTMECVSSEETTASLVI